MTWATSESASLSLSEENEHANIHKHSPHNTKEEEEMEALRVPEVHISHGINSLSTTASVELGEDINLEIASVELIKNDPFSVRRFSYDGHSKNKNIKNVYSNILTTDKGMEKLAEDAYSLHGKEGKKSKESVMTSTTDLNLIAPSQIESASKEGHSLLKDEGVDDPEIIDDFDNVELSSPEGMTPHISDLSEHNIDTDRGMSILVKDILQKGGDKNKKEKGGGHKLSLFARNTGSPGYLPLDPSESLSNVGKR